MNTNPSLNNQPVSQPGNEPATAAPESVSVPKLMSIDAQYKPCLRVLLYHGVPAERIWEVFAPDASGQKPDLVTIKKGVSTLDTAVSLYFDDLLILQVHLMLGREALTRRDLTWSECQRISSQLAMAQKNLAVLYDVFEKSGKKAAKKTPNSARNTASPAYGTH